MITVCAQRVQDLSQVFEACCNDQYPKINVTAIYDMHVTFDLNLLLPLHPNRYCRARLGYTDCVLLKESGSIFAGDLLRVDAESVQL